MKGKVVMVTGAAQGIGRAIAELLAEKGADIALVDVADCAETAAAVEAKGARAVFYKADVGDLPEVEKTVSAVVAEMGGIYGLVNNAGITRDKLLLRMSKKSGTLCSASTLRVFLIARRRCCAT